jgi:hypothetical protein
MKYEKEGLPRPLHWVIHVSYIAILCFLFVLITRNTEWGNNLAKRRRRILKMVSNTKQSTDLTIYVN